jgi:hypothetical protein
MSQAAGKLPRNGRRALDGGRGMSSYSIQAMSPIDRDVQDATDMAAALHHGWRPPAVPAWFRLNPGEALIASLLTDVQQFSGADVTYTQTSFIGFGSPAFLIGGLAGSAFVNASRRRQAERAATPQWRWVETGTLYITTHRLALCGSAAWIDWYYHALHGMFAQPAGIVVVAGGSQHTRFVIHNPLTHLVLIRFLAYGEVPGDGYGQRMIPG